MDNDDEVETHLPPFLIVYKSGRLRRLFGTETVPPSLDASTGVASKDVVIDSATGLAARLYLPNAATPHQGGRRPIFVYIHGGGFVVESAYCPVHHRYLNDLVGKTGAVAVSVDYRLAPEHHLPVAYDDSWATLLWAVRNAVAGGPEEWLGAHGDATRVIVAGVSAGGNIAHNIVLRAGTDGLPDGARIAGMVLQQPVFDRYLCEGDDPEAWQWRQRVWSFASAGKFTVDHPLVNPFAHPQQWRTLPCKRVLVTVADLDSLFSLGKAYADGIKKTGWDGEAALHETKGEGHCFFLNNPDSKEAEDEVNAVAAFINGESPST